MFIAALFTIARIWKQSRCPSADERIRKLCQPVASGQPLHLVSCAHSVSWGMVGLPCLIPFLPSSWVRALSAQGGNSQSWQFSHFSMFLSNVPSSLIDWSGWWAILIGLIKSPHKESEDSRRRASYYSSIDYGGPYQLLCDSLALGLQSGRKVPFASLFQGIADISLTIMAWN